MKNLRSTLMLVVAIILTGVLSAGSLLWLDSYTADAAPLQGRTSVEGHWGLAPTTYILTGTQTLTPTGSLYWMEPSTVLTLTLATGNALPGDFLFISNRVATATTIVDTDATAGGSTRALGDNDIIGFVFNGAEWVEAFFSDNS